MGLDGGEIPAVEAGDSGVDVDCVVPAEGVEAADVAEFAHCTVGLGAVPADAAAVADGMSDFVGELGDSDFDAGADVDVAVARLG